MNTNLFKKLRKNTIVLWILSYIAIILLPIISNVVLYFYAEDVYKNALVFNIIFLLVCLILGAVVSYFFAKRFTRPISALKQIYDSEDEPSSDEAIISSVLKDYRSAKQTKAELEKSKLMEELIGTGQDKVLGELERYDVSFPYQYYCVILFKLINVSKLFEDENDITSLKKYDSVNLIMKNVLEELINEKHKVHICKIRGQITAVVNVNSEYMLDFHEDLRQILNIGRDFISGQFGFSFTPFIGSVHELKTLHKSYTEAINALQYRTFIPSTEIVFCDEQTVENASELTAVMPTEKLKQLVNMLQIGDEASAVAMVSTLVSGVSLDSATKLRVFCFEIISTLLRVVEGFENQENGSKLSEKICKLAESRDVIDIQNKLNEIIIEICKASKNSEIVLDNGEDEDNLAKKDIVAEIKDFISKNYTNQSLNIAMIGEYFNITPYYVSNIFKKTENISMLDYISITRVEKAKELLVTTDMNLESVAVQSGFTNIRTFMRVFQKFEVITPGKYKEVHKQK